MHEDSGLYHLLGRVKCECHDDSKTDKNKEKIKRGCARPALHEEKRPVPESPEAASEDSGYPGGETFPTGWSEDSPASRILQKEDLQTGCN